MRLSLRRYGSRFFQHRVIREAASTFLWVSVSLLVLVGSNSAWLRSGLGVPTDTTPESIFIATVGGLVVIWDRLNLAWGSTLNPSLAVSAAAGGELRLEELWLALLGQFFGHLFAVRLIRAAVGEHYVSRLLLFAPPTPTRIVSFWSAVGFEASMTAVLAFASLSVKRLFRNSLAQLSVMVVLVMSILTLGQDLTGSILNPAMAFSLACFEKRASWHAQDQFVYWIGPLTGSVAGAALYNQLFMDRRKISGKNLNRLRRKSMLESDVVNGMTPSASVSDNNLKVD